MLRFDYTDKDSRQAFMSPGVIFTSVATWICCRQFRSSSETLRPSVFHSVTSSLKSLSFLPTQNLFVKPQRTFCFTSLSCGIAPLDSRDHLPWFICLTYQADENRCQLSRRASCTTVDRSTSERLTRYSDVLETISRD